MNTSPRKIDTFAKHIELLRPLMDASEPRQVAASSATVEQRLLLREMKNDGFIDCVYRCDEKGVPSDFVNIVITGDGRNLVAEYDFVPEPEIKKTNWGMISALISLAGFCAYVLWKLVEVSNQ